MSSLAIDYLDTQDLSADQLLPLYAANRWSSAEKPELLRRAIRGSHSVVTAWDKNQNRLVGLGNAISDGFLVVYYPHLLVHPDYHRRGIGTELMRRLQSRYQGFHQHVLLADGGAIAFYEKCGFQRAGRTEPMWIYSGNDH